MRPPDRGDTVASVQDHNGNDGMTTHWGHDSAGQIPSGARAVYGEPRRGSRATPRHYLPSFLSSNRREALGESSVAIWDKAKDMSVDARRKDEEYHARAMHEVQSGQRRDGLWAKAVYLRVATRPPLS